MILYFLDENNNGQEADISDLSENQIEELIEHYADHGMREVTEIEFNEAKKKFEKGYHEIKKQTEARRLARLDFLSNRKNDHR